jgi:VWFA-related protein
MRQNTIGTLGVCAGLAFGVAVVLGQGLPPSSQQPAAPPPTFRSNVDVVRLDVSVLDNDRHPVRGLTAADFTIEENGHERPIVAFAPVELPAAPAVATSMAAWTRDAPRDVVSNEDATTGRLVVIAFDWSIRSYDQQLARRIASAAVDGLGPTDQASVVFTKPNAEAGAQQGFTADHARLKAAINRPFAVAETCHEPGCEKLLNPEHYEEGECLCGLCTLEAMTSLADTLKTVSQRPKVVMFVGTYVRTFEAMKPTHIPPVVPGVITPTFTRLPGATDCSGRLLEARRMFERAAHAANMTIHVLDPAGLAVDDNTDPLGAGRMRERLDSLPVIADITGGRTVSNTNAPEAQVPAILDESRSYYVIGFEPAAGKVDRERHVEVRVRPRSLSVRARNSYNLADESQSSGRAQPPLTRSVSAVVPRADVPLEISAAPLIADRRGAAVIVGRLGDRPAGPISMLDAAFTLRAQPVTSRQVTLRPVDAGGSTVGPLGVVSALALDPGSYEIRVGTELADGTTGSVHTFVDVPDFARESLSMSGVLLHVAPEDPSAPRDEIDGVLPFAPTARRAFARTDTVSAFVQVSQGTSRKDALVPVAIAMHIVDVQDRVVREQSSTLGSEAFASNRTANAKLAIPTAGLAPGQYLLKLDATTAKKSAERVVRFSIE